jgi:hypothetical protein
MSFMDSARGHLFSFLWKQRQGAFLEMSLDDLKAKLIERATVTAEDFDFALKELSDNGHVDKGVLVDAGADIMASEYKQYLTAAADAAPTERKSEFIAVQADFDVMHAADVAAREAKEVVNP